jgi:prepilin-type N-terminal cleavage/methylation domain-containing protein/prepilin-type processing-associated H-X9-DG protein
MKNYSRQKAFTLVELLVVISIIALLMGILMPAVNKARASAKRTVCKSNLRNVALAFRTYLNDNGEIMPPACGFPSLDDPNDPTSKPPITKFLLPYLSDPEIFRCPADKGKKYFLSEGTSYAYNSRLGGKRISQSRLAKRHDEKERNIHVMYDYDPFHGKPGKPGSKNYLYADWHISDLTKQ